MCDGGYVPQRGFVVRVAGRGYECSHRPQPRHGRGIRPAPDNNKKIFHRFSSNWVLWLGQRDPRFEKKVMPTDELQGIEPL
jgi:hypothetical protein